MLRIVPFRLRRKLTHFAVSPLQIEPASLGFDLILGCLFYLRPENRTVKLLSIARKRPAFILYDL